MFLERDYNKGRFLYFSVKITCNMNEINVFVSDNYNMFY